MRRGKGVRETATELIVELVVGPCGEKTIVVLATHLPPQDVYVV